MLTQKKTPQQRIRISLFGLAVLLIIPMLMTFFALSPTANAARTQLNYSPYLTQVKQRAIALGIGGCIEGRGTKGFGDNLTPQNVASGDWNIGSNTPIVSGVVDPKDGKFDCKEMTSAAREIFGYSSFTEMFCALKGEWRDNANLDCLGNIDKPEYSGNRWNIPKDRGTYAVEVLEKKAGKSLKFDSALVNYSMAMAVLLSNQETGCKAEWRGFTSGEDAPSNIKDLLKHEFNTRVNVALTDGTAAEGLFYIPKETRLKGLMPLFYSNLKQPYKPPKDSGISCGEIAKWASDNAGAAAQLAKTESTENTRLVDRKSVV